MPTHLLLALSLLALLAPGAGASPRSPQTPATPAASPSPAQAYPIAVQLMTLVDHPATLAGQVVQLPPTQVERVISPTLVVVGDPRQHGNYRFYGHNRYDRVLVLLPSAATVARGDLLLVTGRVRSVAGARLTGELGGVANDVIERHRTAPLLIVGSVTTTDDVSVVRPR